MCYDEDVTTTQEDRFERAKLPMLIAAAGVIAGLAIAGTVERTSAGSGMSGTGGAIVLGAWVVGIAALHRLGRAGSVRDGDASAKAAAKADADADEREEEEDEKGD